MPIIRRYGDSDFITGMRAVAATMVVVIHTGAFSGLGWLGDNITASGKYGVQMFFVISGFTIAATFGAGNGYRPYLVRRLFRIAPLYWLMCGLMALLLYLAILPSNYWMERYSMSLDAYNLVMHFLFLSFADYRIAAALIGLEWTIPIEVFWYIVLPLFIVRCHSPRRYLIALGLLFLLAGLTRAVAGLVGPSSIAHWFPTTYGPYFLAGVICHVLRQSGWLADWPYRVKLEWAAVGLFCLSIVLDLGGGGAIIGLASAMIIVLYRPGDLFGLLESRPLLFAGSISYSIYLWHLIVVMLLNEYGGKWLPAGGLSGFAIVYAITLLLSLISYLAVEQPTNRFGAGIARRWAGSGSR